MLSSAENTNHGETSSIDNMNAGLPPECFAAESLQNFSDEIRRGSDRWVVSKYPIACAKYWNEYVVQQEYIKKEMLSAHEVDVPVCLRARTSQTEQARENIYRSLEEMLGGEKTITHVCGDLLLLGPEAIPHLVAGLGSRSLALRELCQRTLVAVGRRASSLLLEAVEDPTSNLELTRRARNIILKLNEGHPQIRLVRTNSRLSLTWTALPFRAGTAK